MRDYLGTTCPSCQHRLRIRTEYIGHRIVCKYCQHRFRAEAPPAISPSVPSTDAVTVELRDSEAEKAKHGVLGLVQEIERLRTDIAERDSKLSALERQVHEAQEQSVRLQGDLDQSKQQAMRQGIELEEIRAVKAQVQSRLESTDTDCERLQARIAALEQSLCEAKTAHEAKSSDLQQVHQEGRAQWEADREALVGQWEEKHQAAVHEWEERLNQAVAERETLQKRFESTESQFHEETARLQRMNDELSQEVDRHKTQAEEANVRVEAFARERDRSADFPCRSLCTSFRFCDSRLQSKNRQP